MVDNGRVRPDAEYPEGYEPGWFQCPWCGGYWHSSEDLGLDVAWEHGPECGPCGGIMMERLDVPGSWTPTEVIEAGLQNLQLRRTEVDHPVRQAWDILGGIAIGDANQDAYRRAWRAYELLDDYLGGHE